MDFNVPGFKNTAIAYPNYLKLFSIKYHQNLLINLEISVEIHSHFEGDMMSFSLSLVSESIDFHGAYLLSLRQSNFSAYRFSLSLSLVSEPIDLTLSQSIAS
jgi:hypothetical protein